MAEAIAERADGPLGLVLNRPSTWERVEVEGADLVLGAPPSGAIRANLVLTSTATTDGLAVLSSTAIAAALAANPGTQVLAADVWPHPVLGDGRRIEFAYPDGEQGVFVSQWVFAVAGHEVAVTFTRAVEQTTALDAIADYLLATITR